MRRVLDGGEDHAAASLDRAGRQPHEGLGAAGAALAERHDVAAGAGVNDVGGVKELGVIAVGLQHLVADAFGIGVAQDRDVVVRRVAGLGGLHQEARRFGQERAQGLKRASGSSTRKNKISRTK